MAKVAKADSRLDERDQFQEDAIAIMRKYEGQHLYSLTGEIYDNLVRSLKQHGDEPLQLLLAASMLVQRIKDLSKWMRTTGSTAKGQACYAYMDSASSIDGILSEFATDSKVVQSKTEGR